MASDDLRREYRRAGKDGLLTAAGFIKPKHRNTDSEIGLSSEKQLPTNPHVEHAATAPISISSGYNPSQEASDEVSPVKKRGTGFNSEDTRTGDPSELSPTKEHPEEDEPEHEQDHPTSPTDSDEKEPKSGWAKFKHDLFKPSGIPVMAQIRKVLFPHYITINWLLLAVPIGIGLHFTNVNPLAIFIVNFLAIIPLAGILSFATEEIAYRVGEVLGGLLNASFGNAVELIVGIIALAKGEIIIVQTSLVGSMLSNLLLVMGMCFFFGGWNRTHQNFNTTVAQTSASLLALAVGSLIIPTAYTWGDTGFNATKSNKDEQLSRGTAIIMLIVYASYLFFQLKSHREIFNKTSEKVEKKPHKKHHHSMKRAIVNTGHAAAFQGGRTADFKPENHPKTLPEDEEEPTLSFVGAILTLCISTAFVGVNAEFLVDSINKVTCMYSVSQYFVGLILLPIVGNAAEHATAVTVAIKDKMDLAIGVAVGSSMQIALLVLPLMVVLGWIIHEDMTLLFDSFQIAVLFVAIILVNYLIGDGQSHWLEGVLLMALYIIIALAAYFYPKQDSSCTAG